MHVFISWSGTQSHAVAVALRTWIPKVLAGKVTPFVSSEDIAQGTRGLTRIAQELETSAFGIVVLTPENILSPWINFEAGALGKSVDSGRVSPLLLGLVDADLNGPLKQFQNGVATDKPAVMKLAVSINGALGDDALPSETVETLFDAHWPALEAAIQSALRMTADPAAPVRKPEDLLDEILTTVRSLQRQTESLSYNNPDREMRLRRARSRMPARIMAEQVLTSAGNLFTVQERVQPERLTFILNEDSAALEEEHLQALERIARGSGVLIRLGRGNSFIEFDGSGVERRFETDGAGHMVLPKDGIEIEIGDSIVDAIDETTRI